MGFFSVLTEIGKNNKNFKTWEKDEKDKLAKREALREKHPHSDAEIEKARQLGENVLNVIDVMDNHSESVAENVETAVQPIVGIAPIIGALGTGVLSYKGILKNSVKKIDNIANEFENTEEVKAFYKKLEAYNDARVKERKRGSYYSVSSWVDHQYKLYDSIKDNALKDEAKKLSKKYLNKTKLARKSILGGLLTIPAAFVASFIGATIYATKLQVDSSKIARFQARKALEDPKAFVNYTPEQIAQAKAEIEANPALRKIKQKSELKQGFFRSIINIFRDRKEYKQAKALDNDDSKIVTRALTPEELAQAERDKEVIQRTVKIINNEAERNSENMEVAAGVLIGGTPILGLGIGFLTNLCLEKTGLINKFVENTIKKNGSEKTLALYKEFKEVKKVNPLYKGRFVKFMKSFAEDLTPKDIPDEIRDKAGRVIKKKSKINSKTIGSLLKASMSHKWVRNGVLGGVTGLVTGLAGAIIGLKLQKSAARAGRFTAKRDLEKDPNNFIGYTQEEYNEVQDVKNTKKDESKIKQYALFIPRVLKQYFEYEKYRKGQFKEEQLLQAQLKKQEVTEKQLSEARNLQRKLFNTFEKVDDNSQIYSETMEAAVEIAQPFVSAGGVLAFYSPFIYVMVQAARGKMSPAQVLSKISGFFSKISKGGNTKLLKGYLNSVERNVSNKVQGQYVAHKPLGVLFEGIHFGETPIYEIISKSWKNLRGSTKELEKLSNEEINNEISKFRYRINKNFNNLKDYVDLFDTESLNELKSSLKEFDSILYHIETLPKESKIDVLDVFLNPQSIKNMSPERYGKAIEALKDISYQVKTNITARTIRKSIENLLEGGKDDVIKCLENKDVKEFIVDEFKIQEDLIDKLLINIKSYNGEISNLSTSEKKEIVKFLEKTYNFDKEKLEKILSSSSLEDSMKQSLITFISRASSGINPITVYIKESLSALLPLKDDIVKLLENKELRSILTDGLGFEADMIESLSRRIKFFDGDIASLLPTEQETVVKILEKISKPSPKDSLLDKKVRELISDETLSNIANAINGTPLRARARLRMFTKSYQDELSKYISEEELKTLIKDIDLLIKNPAEAIGDKSIKESAKAVIAKLKSALASNPNSELNNIPLNESIASLAKKFKLELKPNEKGNLSIVNILEEITSLPQKAKTYTIKDIFNIVPEKMRDPKLSIANFKTKISNMSDDEFAKLVEDKFESMDKATMLKVIDDFETIINNVPKDELNKIWNTMVKEFSEHPDEFMKLMSSGGLKQILFTPELKKALIVAGVSWTAFTLGGTYAIEAWLAEMQLKAGRLGVMKSLEELQDPRYYANIEKTN